MEETSKSDQLITQDNELIQACYRMSMNEKRLLMLGMSKINPMDGYPGSNKPFKFEVTASEWQMVYKDVNAWQSLKRAADNLLTRHVTLQPSTQIFEKINWFDRVKYFSTKSMVEVEFTRSIQIRLVGMLEQFTTIGLFSVNKLRSFYSIRLYELLSQFNATGYRKISLDDFRYAMDSVKTYRQTKDLKRSVLMPAVKEINKQSDIDCLVNDVKYGREITHFEFLFKKCLPGNQKTNIQK